MKITKDFEGLTTDRCGNYVHLFDLHVDGDLEIDLDDPIIVTGDILVSGIIRSNASIIAQNVTCHGSMYAPQIKVKGFIKCNRDIITDGAIFVGDHVKASGKLLCNKVFIYKPRTSELGMTYFEKIKTMDLDELAEFLNGFGNIDGFDDLFCRECPNHMDNGCCLSKCRTADCTAALKTCLLKEVE